MKRTEPARGNVSLPAGQFLFVSWPSQWRGITRRTGLPLCLRGAFLLAFMAGVAVPQSLPNFVSGAKSTAPAANADPLKRDTPRNAIYTFLKACHDDNYLLASQYLDLRKVPADDRAASGPDFAKTLCDFLDRDSHFEVLSLSTAPEGNVADGLAPDLDLLDEVQTDHKKISLYLERTNRQGAQLWLVSSDTVTRIPGLADLRSESAIERHIPEPLVRIEWIGTPLWVWIALFVLAIVLRYISALLSRGLLLILRPVVRRYFKWLDSYRLESFSEPIRLLLSLAVFRACMTFIPPSALVRVYLLNLIVLLFAFGAASLLMRVADLLSDRVITHLNPRERTVSYSVAPLVVRFVKIIIFCVAVLFVLAAWGYNTTTILAGVGVGGLAVALAAQKSIENLFGGISLISDRAVLVGDFCQFGGQVGTVEDIGLRSTRIRTLDRTLVTIPNSQFSTMTLENYSKRDRMWFHPTLQLHRDSSVEQVREMMRAIERILYAEPTVDPTDVPTRFTKITYEAYVIEVFAYVLTPDNNEFLKIQSKLLLQMIEAAKELGILFAVPVQEILPHIDSPVGTQNVEINA